MTNKYTYISQVGALYRTLFLLFNENSLSETTDYEGISMDLISNKADSKNPALSATILMNLYSLFFDRRIAQCCHYKIIELGNRRNITTFVG